MRKVYICSPYRAKDAAELGKHFDTAIDAMTMLLAGFKEESEAQNEE